MNRTQPSHRPRTAAAALLAFGVAWAACADEPALADGAALPDVLDLKTAQQWALANSPSLQAVAERVAQAHELVKQARSLYFPQIDATYSASYTWLAEGTAGPADDALAQVEEFAEYLARQFSPMRSNLPPAQRYRGRHAAQDVEEAIRDLRDVLDGGLEQYALGVTAGYLLFDGFARECRHAMAKFGEREAEAGRREARREHRHRPGRRDVQRAASRGGQGQAATGQSRHKRRAQLRGRCPRGPHRPAAGTRRT